MVLKLKPATQVSRGRAPSEVSGVRGAPLLPLPAPRAPGAPTLEASPLQPLPHLHVASSSRVSVRLLSTPAAGFGAHLDSAGCSHREVLNHTSTGPLSKQGHVRGFWVLAHGHTSGAGAQPTPRGRPGADLDTWSLRCCLEQSGEVSGLPTAAVGRCQSRGQARRATRLGEGPGRRFPEAEPAGTRVPVVRGERPLRGRVREGGWARKDKRQGNLRQSRPP